MLKIENLLIVAILGDELRRVNPRRESTPEDDAKLVASIKRHGVLQPIGVRRDGDVYRLVWGSRRLRCAGLAGLREIPALIVAQPMQETEYRLQAWAENHARADLKTWEVAEHIEAVAAAEPTWTGAEIADKLDLSPAAVSQYRSIRSAHEAVWEAFKAGLLTVPVAYDLTKLPTDQVTAALQARLDAPKPTRGRKPKADAPTERVNRLKCALPGGFITIAGKNLDLPAAIAMVRKLLSELKAAHDQNLSVTTTQATFADRAGKAAGHA